MNIFYEGSKDKDCHNTVPGNMVYLLKAEGVLGICGSYEDIHENQQGYKDKA